MKIGDRVSYVVPGGYPGVGDSRRCGTVKAISGLWAAVEVDHLAGTDYPPFLIQPMDRFEVLHVELAA